MILFRSVRWKNLLSTGNYFTEIKLNQAQNTLIVGENGSGKSTLLDALCFGLFGKAFRNINKPNLLNSINGKDCVVEVEFDVNNKSYKICRGIKPNLFEIYQDGVLLNQDASSRDYQELLEKSILKLNYKSFTQIVILGSASFTPFMQLSSSDRRTIIEDLLDIQIFSVMNNLVKDKLSNNKDLTVNKKYEIELANQKYDMLNKHIAELRQDNAAKILEYEKDIISSIENISTLQTEIETLSKQVATYQEFTLNKVEIESKIKQIEKFESQIESNLNKFKKDVEFFEENDACPTCRQNISAEVKQREIDTLKVKIDESQEGLNQIIGKLERETKKLLQIGEVQKIVQNTQIKIATTNTTISETNKYIIKLRREIELLKETKENTTKELLELQEARVKLIRTQNELKELIEEKSYYDIAASLLKDTGIKTKIIKQYLPIINKLVNKYLVSLDFFVNFNLDESFKETIKSRHRDEFTYNNFSEGEKQRIDMALMLTWRAVAKLKNSANTNLLVLDEVFDSSLDANGTEYLMNILHLLDGVNLFVISHKGDVLQDKFSNVVRFQKNKNFSKIVK